MILLVLGIMLAVGVVKETGVLATLGHWMDDNVGNLLAVGLITQTLSMVLDNFTTAMSMVSLHDTVVGTVQTLGDDIQFMQNGSYWKMIAFAAGVGGNALCIGSLSGLALMKMERIRLAWYFRNVGWKALVGSTIGLIVLYAML